MGISLEDIDQLRERAGITYSKAKEVLESVEGDLLKALIHLEENIEKPLDKYSKHGRDYYRRSQRLLSKLHQTRVKIKVKEDTVVELPVTIGAGIAAFFPKLAALGLLGMIVARGSLEIARPEQSADEQHGEITGNGGQH